PSLAPPLTAKVDKLTVGLDATAGQPQDVPRLVCASAVLMLAIANAAVAMNKERFFMFVFFVF
ncbi:MAG: hypothetical protein ACXVDZ_18060, partial [Bacteroidia bacterium]